jgi:hypothetical protein
MISVCTLLAAVIGAPTAALAQGDAGFSRKCYGTSNPEETIEACTAVIAGGEVDSSDLAAAFKNRGSAYDDMGQ